MDFIFETRTHLLTEIPAWYSKEKVDCGRSKLEFSVHSQESEPVNEGHRKVFDSLIQDLSEVSVKVEEEIQERFEKFSRMDVNPHEKLRLQLEESFAYIGKSMFGSASDKDGSMSQIRANMMSALPPKEEGNDNLTEEEFHRKTAVTATITPFESNEIVNIYVKTPHCYTGEDIIMLLWYRGGFISFDELQNIVDDEFNSQEGKVFQGLKFINSSEVEVSNDDIERFEQELGWKLPDSYKEFLLKINGGTPAIAGEGNTPDFDRLLDDPDDSSGLRWRNFNTDLDEYAKAGFFTFADVGVGFGGHSSIYLKPGEYYGKIFSWYWDSLLSPDEPLESEENQFFIEDNLIADSFPEFIEYLKNQSESEDPEEDRVDIQEWLERSKKHTISVMNHKESIKFIEKLFKKGVTEVFTEGYLDEDDDNIDDFEITLKDDKKVRLELELWLEKKNWLVQAFEKTHWNISSQDYNEDELLGDSIESMLMLKFDFIDYEDMEEWETVKDVVASMKKTSDLEDQELEKEVIKVFSDALGKNVDLNTKVSSYFDF